MLTREIARVAIRKFSNARVTDALKGFSLQSTRDAKWMGRSIRTAYYLIRPFVAQAGTPANTTISHELEEMASAAKQFQREITCLSQPATSAVFNLLSRFSQPQHLQDRSLHSPLPNPLWDRFVALRCELNWLQKILSDSASELQAQKQGTKWRKSQLKTARTELAGVLAGTFERAYGRRPSINTWPSDTRKGIGPWADFFWRICTLLLEEEDVPSLEDVLKGAMEKANEPEMVKLVRDFMPQ